MSYAQQQMSKLLPPSYDSVMQLPATTNTTPPAPSLPPAYEQIVQPRKKYSEVKLYDNSKERALFEELSDLYSIMKATDELELAYSRDAITASAYGEACTRLISQFKTSEAGLISGGKIINIQQYINDYGVDCPRAYQRLILAGVPATIMHASHDDRQEGVLVAETVQCFITAMDGVRLKYHAVDELHPLISDLSNALMKIKGLPPQFEAVKKIEYWLQQLNNKRAIDQLDEDDIRQLTFDLESSYGAFMSHLKQKT